MMKRYFVYLARRTFTGILGLFFVIWMLVVSVDLIEAMREVSKVEGAGMPEAIRMTLFRTPQIVLTLSPFIFLFGTLWAFGQMAKTSEIAVMRAAGLSVWRLVAAPLALAALFGVVTVVAIDPVAAKMEAHAQSIKNEIRGKDENLIEAFRNGIWLRQNDGEIATLIHARTYDAARSRLTGVTVWRSDQDGRFLERWDATRAGVSPSVFLLRNARRTTADGQNHRMMQTYPLPIDIDLRALREDVAKPSALSVWQLPEFIRIMGSAGMSTIDYELRLHDLWSLPLKLAAMALIACAFALGMNARAGGTAALIGTGVAAGFALFIIAEMSSFIATAQVVPVALATWAPGVLAVLFATTILLYREDG